jgi:hypothetical protein
MRTLTTMLLALSVLAGAGGAVQADAYPYGGSRTTPQQEPSPN